MDSQGRLLGPNNPFRRKPVPNPFASAQSSSFDSDFGPQFASSNAGPSAGFPSSNATPAHMPGTWPMPGMWPCPVASYPAVSPVFAAEQLGYMHYSPPEPQRAFPIQPRQLPDVRPYSPHNGKSAAIDASPVWLVDEKRDSQGGVSDQPGFAAERPPSYSEEPDEQPSLVPLPLEGIPEMNILILGETGVGKSTFINAFVNYLTYSNLQEALKSRSLACVIPSSFTWQSLEDGDYVSRHISVIPNQGEHRDETSLSQEHDGTQGQSATQETKIYWVNVGNTKVSLIDTPSIGDTRGNAQDKRNMDNIVEALRAIRHVHGILILLKPNNARLNVMFQFCLKELLTYLHRDAAKNIVFGFTNSRNTSFRPGETYTILKHMLDKDPDVPINLSRDITFCFDSESFRCLAASNNGIDIHDMGDIQDYRISWEKSATETYRMLEHFRPSNTAPHDVYSTWSLHRTREIVRVLTRPMADITQTINSNIALMKDEQASLHDKMKRGDKLKGELHMTKIVYEMKELDMPRTVCSDKACVEYKDDKRHYKSLCHDPCYLQNVEVDKIQCEQLLECWAFGCGSSDTCRACGHRWQVHLHILWEPVERKVKVEDDAVKRRIQENASDVELVQTAIRSRQKQIDQYEKERGIIQKAAGQFSVYLKRSSIKPYNDSKLAYLDHLIEEERGKVQAGGSRRRLEELVLDRRQHEEEVRTLTEYARSGENDKLLDQDGIEREIKKLYALNLTGSSLRKAAGQLEAIQRATYKDGWGGKGSSARRLLSRTRSPSPPLPPWPALSSSPSPPTSRTAFPSYGSTSVRTSDPVIPDEDGLVEPSRLRKLAKGKSTFGLSRLMRSMSHR